MPHILTTKHQNIPTPSSLDDVVFKFIATSKKENKILVETKNKEFFLTTKEKDGNILVKVDNSTRVSPVSIVKHSLEAYGKISKSKILFSNITNTSQKVQPQKEYLKDIGFFVNDFQTSKDIIVEVGFGSGRHLIYQALKNPDKLIIGLEIHTASIEQMLKQVALKGIKNILAVNYDARLFLEFMQSNSIETIYVHFPVPWDKKPHRRVMSDEFISQSLRALKVGGKLELRTDSPNYFEYSKELLKSFKNYPSKIIQNQDLEVTSKYETRWKNMGKDIWDIKITSTTNDSNIVLNKDFSFDKDIDTTTLDLPTKPIVKDDFVVHFEDIFNINDKDILIQVTFGSFNKPLNKFIIIQDKKASYFQDDPIPTSTNHKAHTLIKEVLI